MNKTIQSASKAVLTILRENIRQIFAAHLVYAALGVAVFAPLAGVTGQLLLRFAGQSVLSDLDIVYFLFTLKGVLVTVLFAALTITILVFEQAALMAICGAALMNSRAQLMAVLNFTVQRIHKIFHFALLLVIRVLFITLPFLAISVAIAWVMLTGYDINYYLAEKPPVFLIAAVSITLTLLTMAKVLFRHLSSWAVALPLILFNDHSPAQSFAASEKLTKGHEQFLLAILGRWALITIMSGTIILGAIQILGSILAPFFFNSMTLLVPALGGLVILWLLANFLTTTIISGSFATLLMFAHRRCGSTIDITLLSTAQAQDKRGLSPLLLTLTIFTSVAAAVLTGYYLLNTIPVDNNTMIIAHRGAAGKAPENTLPAIDQAIHDKTDWIEIDVQESSDGEIVVIHDSDFMKLAGVNLKIWDGTLQQIKGIDVGSWFSPEFADERVPSLLEVLDKARGNCRVLIELKYYGHDELLEQRVADIVEQAGMIDDVAIMSLKHEGIKRFRALRPSWNVGLLLTKAIGKLSDLDMNFLAINMASAKPSFIRRIQSSGKKVFVWTVNDQLSMSRMMSLGVDGIITDEPALARETLDRHAKQNPMESLLIHTAVLFNRPILKQAYRDKSP
ncbi:MAG TPA: glycerophosphodiester phosphodiesterase [Desulfocapsa sulfexigens]|nr:glycerophosphodiester phosphodiesterase [Desulfocapsa sulfexigens]